MTILDTFRRRHPRSAALYAQASNLFPNGVTHDGRFAAPFPLYVERSAGGRKWDADGNEIIDYWTGHGALLLGHGHPAVVAAVQEQVARGTHYGAEHPIELRWAELVQRLFPGMERLRFTASGTEATMLALRLARAFTGRPTVLRFEGHYHGWHDLLTRESDADAAPGLYGPLVDSTLVLPADLDRVEETLRARQDIAAVILEPTGASYGAAPLRDDFLRELRRLTEAHGVLLVCDEVVTGFRVTPGGVQQRAGVTADLTALAKILAGGLPGGAVGGRADVMRHLEFGDTAWNRSAKIRHNGTYNANPLSAAAGVATLELVATGAPGARAASLCRTLIDGMNDAIRSRELAGWAAYGDESIFHLLAGSRVPFAPGELPPDTPFAELKRGGNGRLLELLRLALLNHGVDLMRGRSGFLSAAHTEEDVAATVRVFAAALDDVLAEYRGA
ncbi:MAG TPA: aminotransferase class III-fold pyridoxal phosphate-dependent enzyme [Roseiflexaceae bacterium]|nr:aminotransferase class III-fold pyridoxal phosphate-dependent enzyme [Roseiflexaceae bacterium]